MIKSERGESIVVVNDVLSIIDGLLSVEWFKQEKLQKAFGTSLAYCNVISKIHSLEQQGTLSPSTPVLTHFRCSPTLMKYNINLSYICGVYLGLATDNDIY